MVAADGRVLMPFSGLGPTVGDALMQVLDIAEQIQAGDTASAGAAGRALRGVVRTAALTQARAVRLRG